MKKLTALLLAAVLSASPVEAEDAPPALPPALLDAIGIQESGMYPLAVNVAGRDHYPASREEAMRIIRQARMEGKSFDVGLYQINSWWMERYGIPPESLLDPVINRQWGMFVLSQEIARHGLTWKAVGKYHSPDRERGRRYAWLIYRNYARSAAKERDHGKTLGSQNLSHGGGIWRNPSVRQPGRIVTFDIQQAGMPGDAGSEPGAP
jgi:soluble lytic murein transglycosylase-like protein